MRFLCLSTKYMYNFQCVQHKFPTQWLYLTQNCIISARIHAQYTDKYNHCAPPNRLHPIYTHTLHIHTKNNFSGLCKKDHSLSALLKSTWTRATDAMVRINEQRQTTTRMCTKKKHCLHYAEPAQHPNREMRPDNMSLPSSS